MLSSTFLRGLGVCVEPLGSCACCLPCSVSVCLCVFAVLLLAQTCDFISNIDYFSIFPENDVNVSPPLACCLQCVCGITRYSERISTCFSVLLNNITYKEYRVQVFQEH